MKTECIPGHAVPHGSPEESVNNDKDPQARHVWQGDTKVG